MSDNPLENDPARDARIRERAYHLWEADGRPHGRHDEYWERASELIGMEGNPEFGQLPNPATLPGADPNRTEPVEEAFLQANLGEFPDRFADQGEAHPTPMSREDAREALAEDPPTGAEGLAADAPGQTPAKKTKPLSAGKADTKPSRRGKSKGD
ncbi:DUF2934 domain-containing protein [Lichenicola sp.]|uniref:DUF2934 domain-containing protein n=1 Tax=Lichenicola sp. TaxID=2804529 RepID=UPI003AFF7F18